MSLKYIGIIPARYASTRFPGKPLAMLHGKPIIERVYERVKDLFDTTVVATDDMRITECVQSFGGKVVMTSPKHRSGTDRCHEALLKVGAEDYDIVVNVQGDEPFVVTEQIQALKNCFECEDTQIATLVHPFAKGADYDVLANPNSPKVVFDNDMNALYFSRSVIPFVRSSERRDWTAFTTFYKHIGLYAYRSQVLREITSLPQSRLELAESLEQLRWLENGYRIKVAVTNQETIGIDTPDDLQRAERFMTDNNK